MIPFDSYTIHDPLFGTQKPLPWQKPAVEWLLNMPLGILGDDMGLGKTRTVIMAALTKKAQRVLIVCPSALKYNWARELLMFNHTAEQLIKPEDVAVIDSGKQWKQARFTIISYSLLSKFHELGRSKKRDSKILEFNPDVVIADEAHSVKNAKSQRTKYFTNATRGCETIWLLTGTPITNRPIDFFQLLYICRHPLSKNFMSYGQRYCDGQHNGFGWSFNGASNLHELHLETKDIILRRTKEQVKQQYPEHLGALSSKQRIPVFLRLSNKRKYDSLVKKHFDDLQRKIKRAIDERDLESPYFMRDSSKGQELVEIAILKKWLAQQKIKHTIELIEDALERESKVIVFTNYTDVLQKLVSKFSTKCVFVDGSQKAKQKDEAVQQFQTDAKTKIIIANMAAGSVGFNMTAGNVVIMNDLYWNMDRHIQAEDRSYRLGQDKFVTIQYPLFMDTLDVVLYKLILAKKNIASIIIDGMEQDDLSIVDLLIRQAQDN